VGERDLAACMRVFGQVFDNAQRLQDLAHKVQDSA
jgi:hypothetical protein